MRPLWIVAVVVLGVFALATAASASMREEVGSVAAAVGDLVTPTSDPSPSLGPVPSSFSSPVDPSPLPSDTGKPAPEPTATVDAGGDKDKDRDKGGDGTDSHGDAVSAVAQDESAVGTKTLPNGKTVTNHGQAVSAVARSDAGQSDKSGGNGGGNGKH